MESMTTEAAITLLKSLSIGDRATVDAGADAIEYVSTRVGGIAYLVCINSGQAITPNQFASAWTRFGVKGVHAAVSRLTR